MWYTARDKNQYCRSVGALLPQHGEMNLYEYFVRLTHPVKRFGWEETTAYFTGKCRTVPKGRGKGRHYPAMTVTTFSDVHEYEIRYYTKAEERTGWYLFYPGPEPDPGDIKEMSMTIRYKKSRPWIFEKVLA